MLKIVAALIMLIDHMGAVFFPDQMLWRLVGRLAMPIFACGIAQGFQYTSSFKAYLKRVGIFALISQIPFWMMIYVISPEDFTWIRLNIGFTFFFALIVLYLLRSMQSEKGVNKVISSIGVFAIVLFVESTRCDYGAYGIMVVWVFYKYYVQGKSLIHTGRLFTMVTVFFGIINGQWIQLFALPSLFLIESIKEGSTKRLRYFFYIFYPMHMLLLSAIKWWMLY